MLSMLLFVATAEAKKPKTPPPPPVGWHREEGWKGDCYYAPDFATLPPGDRKMARQTALEGMKSQWSGTRDDGVSFDANLVDEVETVLLGRPENIEAIALSNRDQCVAYMKGGEVGAWHDYLSALPPRLTKGECMQPLTYTMFDYLDIGKSWQRPLPMCKGDKAHIIATAKDRYRVTDTGAWINVQGTGEKAIGAEFPCNIEGCFVGMLVGKFTTEEGVETVFPIGVETTFTAPEHGTISYSINDTVWYDNKWFKSATIEDRTAITIEPGQ
jgi:hypothetical protein